jgi:hypothetical protein
MTTTALRGNGEVMSWLVVSGDGGEEDGYDRTGGSAASEDGLG